MRAPLNLAEPDLRFCGDATLLSGGGFYPDIVPIQRPAIPASFAGDELGPGQRCFPENQRFLPPSGERAGAVARAGARPGLEAGRVPRGSPREGGLRSHELFPRDEAAQRGRSRRYVALSVAAVFALMAAGVGWRVSEQGQEAFVDGMAAKYH